MKHLLTCLFGLGLLVGTVQGGKAQVPPLQPAGGLASNTVQELGSVGDSLWVGTLLRVYVEEEGQFLTPDDPVVQSRLESGRTGVYSLETEDGSFAAPVVWVGLAFNTGANTVGADGFLVSTDGGHSFTERPVHLDEPSDTTVTYGVSTLPATPITQAANSAPQDLTIGGGSDTVWVAGGRSGLRRSTDQGQTWSRIVLPPDTSTRIDPSIAYNFLVSPPIEGGRGFQNHVAYSVLMDETGTVWAGTAAGVNRSMPDDVGPNGARAWRLFPGEGPTSGIPGQAVITLEEQPRPDGRNPIWLATWARREQGEAPLRRFGVSMTPDGGDTFRSMLIGERVYALAARTDRVYAAAQSGLFVSGNRGSSWRSVEEVRLQNEDRTFSEDLSARSVEVTPSALWVGTTDGLLRLDRSDEPALLSDDPSAPAPQWRLFRADVPVDPEAPTEAVPDVGTYAYPNPFVPSRDGVVRIVYEVPEPQRVEVNIYDFAMNRVRTLHEQESAGQQEMAWKGTDEGGLRLPTGTYLYTVELGERTLRGKILLSN